MQNADAKTFDLEGNAPRHIAIVMDGNGRWAQSRGLPRYYGHIQGAAILKDVVTAAIQFGIQRLTLYCFSSENWKRPKEELDALMSLLEKYMVEQRSLFMENNIRLKVLGRQDRVPDSARREIAETLRLTELNTGLTLALAINYGGRQEIVDAARKTLQNILDLRNDVNEPLSSKDFDVFVNEKTFAQNLYDGDSPDPDLFIRTGGEKRLSNFLLWQLSYAELWFTDVLWPDFTPETLKEAILAFQRRRRRFGGLDKTSNQ